MTGGIICPGIKPAWVHGGGDGGSARGAKLPSYALLPDNGPQVPY